MKKSSRRSVQRQRKKIVCFGAGGQIGSELSLLFHTLQDQYHFIPLGRYDCDLNQTDTIIPLLEKHVPDILINCATCKKDKGDDILQAIHMDAITQMAYYAAEHHMPMIHLSTSDVVGNVHEALEAKISITPEYPCSPVTRYDQTKYAGEQVLAKTHQQHIIVRLGWLFGLFGQNFVKETIRAAKQKQPIMATKDWRGCPTSARSVAVALVKIVGNVLQPEFNAWGTYHFANKSPITQWGFAKTILSAAHQLEIIDQIPSLQSCDKGSEKIPPIVMDCTKTWDVFSLAPVKWTDELVLMLQA